MRQPKGPDRFRVAKVNKASFGSAADAMVQIAQHHGREPYDTDEATNLYTFNLNGAQAAIVAGRMSEPLGAANDGRELELYIQDGCLSLAHLIISQSVRTAEYEANVMWNLDALKATTNSPNIGNEVVQDAMRLFGRLGEIASYSMATRISEVNGVPSFLNLEALLLEPVPFDLSGLCLPGVTQPSR